MNDDLMIFAATTHRTTGAYENRLFVRVWPPQARSRARSSVRPFAILRAVRRARFESLLLAERILAVLIVQMQRGLQLQ